MLKLLFWDDVSSLSQKSHFDCEIEAVGKAAANGAKLLKGLLGIAEVDRVNVSR